MTKNAKPCGLKDSTPTTPPHVPEIDPVKWELSMLDELAD
jgi:hypothetical protein